eukprot:CAMPEP_0178423134 /NCGR_PEP_ID=MMETSP0689_2-20121128/27533_1 /TAXON_ID=160604 /ORGANISM="Amphidinium massartii, Strain CS-259" /LENGTH=339 /DNA_ID=CAMNT_0020044721 /DNA_START=73 /DNA_END=1092 /DNA_ORIENTATION=-
MGAAEAQGERKNSRLGRRRRCFPLLMGICLSLYQLTPPAFLGPPRSLRGSDTKQKKAGNRFEASKENALLAAPWLIAAGGSDVANAAGVSAVEAGTAAATASIKPVDAIVQAFLLTFVSEIGDKTFFIAAILAAGGSALGQQGSQDQRLLTFIGAIAALAVMTFLAVGLGQIFHAVPDVAGGLPIDDYASILAFGFFGIKLLSDATQMEEDGSLLDEKEEAEADVRGNLPAWVSGGAATVALPALVLQAFVLVFAAEIGDRSFISAAALSAQGGFEAATSVFVGGITAHALATLLAVLVGEVIAKYVTERQITYIGGVLFLVFAAMSAASLLGFDVPMF